MADNVPLTGAAYVEYSRQVESARDAAIKKWRAVFDVGGFGSYAIDFSDVDAELIERLGQTIETWLKEKSDG